MDDYADNEGDTGDTEEGDGHGQGHPPHATGGDPEFDGPWSRRVVFASKPGGGTFAFRPGQLLTTHGAEALEILREEYPNADVVGQEMLGFTQLGGIDDPLRATALLRIRGIVAQVNHVMFAHGGCGCGCGGGGGGGCPPHPSGGWGTSARSVHPTPHGAASVHPTPFFLTSVHPTPGGGCGCGCGGGTHGQSVHPTPATSVHPTPAHSWPLGATATESVHPTPVAGTSVHPTPGCGCGCGCRCGSGGGTYGQSVHPTPVASVHPTPLNAMGKKSSARPAPAATPKAVITTQLAKRPRAGGPRVVVLDTGLAAEGKFFPQALRPAPVAAESDMDFDVPDLDVPADGLLDQVAGHGTFIAGLICQVAPGTDVTVHRVLATVGDTDEWRVVHRLLQLKNTLAEPERTILSLSFGGYVLDFPILLAAAITDLQGAKVVVVASAGNDATCEPMYPAALPGVVSVGAIGPDGPARFTNYGSWVRACAPGVDLLSTFFQFQGVTPAQGQLDPDDFDGWAVWSGTSFSAPIVAGALARTMALENCTAEDAVERIVDNPSLLRIPGLGTVVNVL